MNTIVTESTEHGEVPINIYQKLANDRILFLCDSISDKVATDICAALMLNDRENPEEKITLFINSDGGSIRNVFMIYDVMNMIEAPVQTVCIGSAMNEASLLLMAGEPGLRIATKNAVIAVSQLIHNFMMFSDLADAKSIVDQSTEDNKRVLSIIAKSTGKTVKQVSTDFSRKVFMNAPQAVKYGIIDKVVTPSRKAA